MTAPRQEDPAFVTRGEKSDPAYAPSFSFDGPLLSESHGAVHGDVATVDGWLEPQDSLKLYELGYLAPGPFLEIGTFRGKSTTVLARALRDAGRRVDFYSLDIARDDLESARATLDGHGLGDSVTLVHGSLTAFFRALPAFQPRFVFLDGDHSAAGLGRDLASLEARVPEGGLLLFHDYVNPRNDDPADRDYGVTQAIRESWVPRDCEFAGSFGCSGLYRRVRGPHAFEATADPPILQLMPLDRHAIRILVTLARPLKRTVRRAIARTRRRPRS